MRKLRIPLVDILRMLGIATIGILLLLALFTWRLEKLHGGFSSTELPAIWAVRHHALHLKELLLHDALFLPYSLGLWLFDKVHLNSLWAIRLLGVMCGLLGTTGFYLVIRGWHTRRVALMTTFLFATSSLFLYTARAASPAAMYLLTPWLIYFGIRLQQNNLRLTGLAIITLGSVGLLYIPGLAWFILPAAIWQRRLIRQEFSHLSKTRGALIVGAAAVLLLPLLATLSTRPENIRVWLTLTSGHFSIVDFLKDLVGIPIQLLVRSNADPATHVGRLPYLDVATVALAALGAYWYFFLRKLDRTKLLLGGLIGGSILAALNIEALPILLPFIYLIAGAGLTLLLQQWFTVFPRNPLARRVGISLVAVLLGFIGYYHMHRYFVAWPHTPETRAAYSHRI